MFILQVEHPVRDYDQWKKLFDNDPADRRGAGVTSYHIFRQTEDPNNVLVELEFSDLEPAKKMLASLQQLWKQIDGKIITGPRGRIFELTEEKKY